MKKKKNSYQPNRNGPPAAAIANGIVPSWSDHPNGTATVHPLRPMATDGLAVVVDSVAFNYRKNVPLLKDVSVNVPKGRIYSLLGSNGCGKTTLLNILLGRIRPQRGQICILGRQPGPELNHQIGYMPQELGLNPFLYIEDTFFYFAHVNHVKDTVFIHEQIRRYLDMLNLFDPKKRVGELSGGQKRLLSLGVTLIYKPRILLLDEPTVGIDSLIRSKIWNHLRQLCLLNQTTVIITTHYIDEAKQSDLVGFLHEGQMLAEESPDVLMRCLGCKTLEQVFLRLCHEKDGRQAAAAALSNTPYYYFFKYHSGGALNRQRNYDDGINNDNNNDPQCPNRNHYDSDQQEVPKKLSPVTDYWAIGGDTIPQHQQNESGPPERDQCSRQFLNRDHVWALFNREWFFFRHNLKLFAVFLLMPIITTFLFDSSYGRTPRNVPIAIFNGDRSAATNEPHLSDIFLREFNDSMVRLDYFHSEEDAWRSVERGKNVIAIAFRKNFSSSLIDRYYNFHSFDMHKLPEEVVDPDGSMHLYIDHSSLLNVRYVNRSILLAFQRMIEKFGTSRGINPAIFSLPIEKREYIYGTLEPHFQDLFLPGIIILTLMAMNTVKSSFEIIFLHQNGSLRRDINQGIRPFELLFTFIASSMVSIFWQVLSLLVFTFYIMQVELLGDFIAVYVLVFTTTCQGLLIGTLVSVLFPEQVWSMLLCFTVLVIMFFTSGTLWPIEGMSTFLQQLFQLNPIVLPVRSFRFIMLRGWSAWKLPVLAGYLISITFDLILFVVSAISFHYLNIRIK